MIYATGATVHLWGMSSSAFLLGYGVVLTMVVLATLAYRVGGHQPDHTGGNELGPHEIGYLCGGRLRAIHVSLTWLRTTGIIDANRQRFRSNRPMLAVTDACPANATDLDRAVYAAAERGSPVMNLRFDREVARALRTLRQRMEELRLVRSLAMGRALVLAAIALATLGAARYLAAAVGGDHDWWLVGATSLAGAVAITLGQSLSGLATASGQETVRQHRESYRSARADLPRPDWAAKRVAHFGLEALRVIDAMFGERAGLLGRSFTIAGSHSPRSAATGSYSSGAALGYYDGGFEGGGFGGGGGGGDGGGGC